VVPEEAVREDESSVINGWLLVPDEEVVVAVPVVPVFVVFPFPSMA
jgi:hypothetical protein